MGWTGGSSSRSDAAADATEGWKSDRGVETSVVRRAYVGNNLWTVWRIYDPQEPRPTLFIAVVLLRRTGPQDWAWKIVDETMGPCEQTCPISFLDEVPEPAGSGQGAEWSRGWRAKVRARAASVLRRDVLRPGVRVRLRPGSQPAEVVIVEDPCPPVDRAGRTRPRVIGVGPGGGQFRVPRRSLVGAEIVTGPAGPRPFSGAFEATMDGDGNVHLT